MNRIGLDENGININGCYRILMVASLFYFRIPAARWDERMKMLKSAGYNAIDVYFPWNYHETEPGAWNFEENKNVEQFLKLAEDNGLWVIARPGPYICSEWDGGAIPAWLYLEDMHIRQTDQAYLGELSKWYDRILPIIKKHQWTEGGSVILLQIENELDFFLCETPEAYMKMLVEMAENVGIQIPLIACCGQDDIHRSGADAEGVTCAFNIYGDCQSKGLEERVHNLYKEMNRRRSPLLVTETNREHSWLKRLLSGGAKMLAPYNQVAGSTMDYYNAITNWGGGKNPLSLLASDYDFQSMAASDGSLKRDEYVQARLLNGLLATFGEDLAKAPTGEAGQFVTAGGSGENVSVIRTAKGQFYAVNNLKKSNARLFCGVQEDEFPVYLPPLYTALLPVGVLIGKEDMISWSNYEIAFMENSGQDRRIAMHGKGTLCMKLVIQGREIILKEEQAEGEVVRLAVEGYEICYGSPEQIARMDIPGLLPWSMERWNRYEQDKIIKIEGAACRESEAWKEVPVGEMERNGQYRGSACYEIEIPKSAKYLISGLSDIVTVYRDNTFQNCFYGDGKNRIMTLAEGTWRFGTEIWGHSNFDDIRIPSLRLGSLKGISSMRNITHEADISDNWELELKYGGSADRKEYKLLTDIDKYNIPLSPVTGVYRKTVKLWQECKDFVLYFEKADCRVAVKINGVYMGEVSQGNPWIELDETVTSGEACSIELEITRKYYADQAGPVLLFGGQKLESCRYRDSTFWGEMPEAEWTETLPVFPKPGEDIVFMPEIPGKTGCDKKFFFKGKDILLTAAYVPDSYLTKDNEVEKDSPNRNTYGQLHKHIVGRVLLGKKMPTVAGGPANELFLCGDWHKEGKLVIKCQALTEKACLEEIQVKIFQ